MARERPCSIQSRENPHLSISMNPWRPANEPQPRAGSSGAHRVLLFGDLNEAVDGTWTARSNASPLTIEDPCPEETDDDPLFLALRIAVETQLSNKQREVVEAHFFQGLS